MTVTDSTMDTADWSTLERTLTQHAAGIVRKLAHHSGLNDRQVEYLAGEITVTTHPGIGAAVSTSTHIALRRTPALAEAIRHADPCSCRAGGLCAWHATLADLHHELGHLCFGSFAPIDPKRLPGDLIALARSAVRSDLLRVKPNFDHFVNVAEDCRVDAEIGSRFVTRVEPDHVRRVEELGLGNLEGVAGVLAAALYLGEGFDLEWIEGWFDESVVELLRRPGVADAASRVGTGENISDSFARAWDLYVAMVDAGIDVSGGPISWADGRPSSGVKPEQSIPEKDDDAGSDPGASPAGESEQMQPATVDADPTSDEGIAEMIRQALGQDPSPADASETGDGKSDGDGSGDDGSGDDGSGDGSGDDGSGDDGSGDAAGSGKAGTDGSGTGSGDASGTTVETGDTTPASTNPAPPDPTTGLARTIGASGPPTDGVSNPAWGITNQRVTRDQPVVKFPIELAPGTPAWGSLAWNPHEQGWYDRPLWAVSTNDDDLRMRTLLAPTPPALLNRYAPRLRRALAENQRGKSRRHLKRGKIRGADLARTQAGFDRPFHKRDLPLRRDFAAVIGLDWSGSTDFHGMTGPNGRSEMVHRSINRMAIFEADLLDAIGVPFTIMAHTSLPYDKGPVIYVIKRVEDPWDLRARRRLCIGNNSGSYRLYGNLDGSSLRFYRQVAQETRATDALVLYHTDGAMPAEDYGRQAKILIDETTSYPALKRRRDKRVHVIGMAVSDAAAGEPQKFGIDTIEFGSNADLDATAKTLISGLADRLEDPSDSRWNPTPPPDLMEQLGLA